MTPPHHEVDVDDVPGARVHLIGKLHIGRTCCWPDLDKFVFED